MTHRSVFYSFVVSMFVWSVCMSVCSMSAIWWPAVVGDCCCCCCCAVVADDRELVKLTSAVAGYDGEHQSCQKSQFSVIHLATSPMRLVHRSTSAPR